MDQPPPPPPPEPPDSPDSPPQPSGNDPGARPPSPGMGECIAPGPAPTASPSSPAGVQPPPPGPSQAPRIPGPGGPPRPMPPAVNIINRSGGFGRGVLIFITGIVALGFVFGVGIMIGAMVIFAGTMGAGLEAGLVTEVVEDGNRNNVAVITVEGTIDARQAEYVNRAVGHVLDRHFDAVVLRIDSGGGGVTASDQIWHDVGKLSAAGIPVVASYGSAAASGGYYISCASDFIMAEETCITGSIGVQAQILTMGDLMNKVGIEPVTLAATGSPRKNIANDTYRQWNEEDRAEVVKILDAAYETFLQRVRQGRSHVITDPARIDALADGSVFTSQEALNNGLIDGVGYLEDAISQAETIAGIPVSRSTVVMISRPAGFTPGDLFFMRQGTADAGQAWDAEAIRSLVDELSTPRFTYLMQ